MSGIKTYSEAMRFASFEARFEYLQTFSPVGSEVFGYLRYLNQKFYASSEWKRIRNQVIMRDDGCDLSIPDRPIRNRIVIHHIEPLTPEDIFNRSNKMIDLDNLICASELTHRALHFGDITQTYSTEPVIRRPNDTCPWKELR